MSYTKLLVIALILMTILFTATVLLMMRQGMEEPETLVRCWFSGFISELLACAGIKVSKVRHKYKRPDDDDDEEPVG